MGLDLQHAKISVVIPVLNAEGFLPTLLPAIFDQTPRGPDEVIILDSMSTDRSVEIARSFPRVRVVPVPKFSHGGSRNLGAREAAGDIVVLMTQDAKPRDRQWLRTLIAPLADARVAATYSRQVPYPEASPMERYFLLTHFPPEGARRGGASGHESLQSVFFSNVSAALRRDLLLQYPFDETLIMSEDQQVSRDLIKAGYEVVYVPESAVIHSHNYTLSVCFRRYFDSVYSLTLIFPKHDMGTSASMGFKYLWREFAYMCRNHPIWLPYYALYTVAKTAGTVAGHFAERLPRWLVRRLSLHAYHWA